MCHPTHPPCRNKRLWLPMIGLALALPSITAASPALEYGPETEARFRARCEEIGATPRNCQALMERLQARLGYAAFLESAELGPNGFEMLAGDLPLSAPTLLARRP